jgi:hypothetical protein
MKIRLIALSAVAAAALAFAACGDDDDSSSDSASSSSTTTATASVDAFCDSANEVRDLNSTFSGLQPNDIEGAQEAFQTALDKIQGAADVAPEDIKPDIDALVSSFSNVNDAIQGADSAEDLQQLGTDLQSDLSSLQEHAAALQSYYKDNCK